MTKKHIAVLAGNSKEFWQFATSLTPPLSRFIVNENAETVEDPNSNVVYHRITSSIQARGHEFSELKKLGSYGQCFTPDEIRQIEARVR